MGGRWLVGLCMTRDVPMNETQNDCFLTPHFTNNPSLFLPVFLEPFIPMFEYLCPQSNEMSVSANFLSLPAELRNKIYAYLLVRREPIGPSVWDLHLVPSILCTNKQILHEARSLLYGYNHFNMTTWKPGHVIQFLDDIGFVNASHLKCIHVDFPRLRDLEEDVTLEKDSLRVLEKIHTHCTNLKTLITSSNSTNAMEYQLDTCESPSICAKAFALIDAHFRAVASLQEIVIEVFEEGPSLDIRRGMKECGWTIKVVEPVEEADYDSDRFDIDFEYHEYFDDDYDDEEYDIDNDSDFWRRAVD